MKVKSFFTFCLIVLVSFFHYKLAKIAQLILSYLLPSVLDIWLLVIPWILLSIILNINSLRQSGLFLNIDAIKKNKKIIILFIGIIFIGLVSFIFLGVTKYFHTVRYPLLFFIATPIVEELIFRGWVYGKIEKYKNLSPVFLSALLFGLNHLQYTNFIPTHFVLFQIVYAFILGIFLGKIRQYSKSVYIGMLVHIFINFMSVYF